MDYGNLFDLSIHQNCTDLPSSFTQTTIKAIMITTFQSFHPRVGFIRWNMPLKLLTAASLALLSVEKTVL
jgi:hypothetical protein